LVITNNQPTTNQGNKMKIDELTFLIRSYDGKTIVIKFETLRSFFDYLNLNIDTIEAFEEIEIHTIK